MKQAPDRRADTEGRRDLEEVLDHPVRQRIIELLGARGPMGWKSLSSELGVRTGALYYHVDMLEGIVMRDADRRYTLTKAGTQLFVHLKDHAATDPLPDLRFSAPYGPGQRFLSAVFWPRPVIEALTSSRTRATLTLALVSLGVLAVSLYLGHAPELFYLGPVTGALYIGAGYLLSLASMLGMSYFATRLLFGVSPSAMVLASACAFSMIPIVVFLGGSSLLYGASGFTTHKSLFTVLTVFFQSWSASLLAAGISVSSGLRIEKSLLLSLMILYATMAILFVQGSITF